MFPIIFQTKIFALHSIWLFTAIAVIAGTYALIKFTIKNGLKIQFLNEHSFKMIVWLIIGSRIAGIIEHYQDYFYQLSARGFLRIFYVWDRGLSLWGGATALLVYFYLVCKKEEQDFWRWLDALAPAGLIAMAIINIGAFFDGINYGNETSLPWGVNFSRAEIKYVVPIHPTQIYAFLYCLLIAGLAVLASNNKKIQSKNISGLIGIGSTFLFSIFRFFEEFVRGDDTFMILGIRLPQIIIFLILIFSGVIFYLRYNGKSFKPLLKKRS